MNKDENMKVWVTRQSSISLQCGGLERCLVWFTKPIYIPPKMWENEIDMCFGSYRQDGCYRLEGWSVGYGCFQVGVPAPILFGFESDAANYIWTELEKHFGNVPFIEWHEYEKTHPECCVENFLLEFNIEIKKI